MLKILIVEDQPAVATALEMLFDIRGYSTVVASGPEEALEILDREAIGVVIQDMNFTANATSGEEGVALFRRLRQRDAELPVFLITAWTSLETAVQLVKEGASDYLAKPWDDDKLLTSVQNLMRLRSLQLENRQLRGDVESARLELAERHPLCDVVYGSRAMHDVVVLGIKVATSNAPILITGPSGVGKEKVAEIVQANSRRADKPFIRVNAGALPEELLESELFGAEVGAFTGSAKKRLGRFEAADGGTLFLDEIGNLPLSGQIKLLRVLQSGEFERLGSSHTRRVDTRIICATNADLRQEIQAGRFREDLFFRLNVIEIELPSLAQRRDDILPLAEHFLASSEMASSTAAWRLSEASRQRLVQYAWPGNVRQLENVLQRATLIARGPLIEPNDLQLEERSVSQTDAVASPPSMPASSSGGASSQGASSLETSPDEEAEKSSIEAALIEAQGVVAQAASSLGMSRQALYRRMQKYGLGVERRLRG